MSYMEEKIKRLNRETQEYRNRCVDRFNPSTQSNYDSRRDLNYQNSLCFRENNGQFPPRSY